MAEEIIPNIFRITVPLPRNPLKFLNSYVLCGEERSLVVDTGLNRPECLEALQQGLGSLGLDPEKTDIFITHMHSDHSGLAPEMSSRGARVFASATDAAIINDRTDWSELMRFAWACGLPEDKLLEARDKHPGYKYRPTGQVHFSHVADGDVLDLGGYRLRCLHTPGHTAGHICLYEPEKKLFLAGDHILEEITPNISQWREGINPLGDYLHSLDKVSDLQVELVLPGHRRLFADFKGRIATLKAHHERRLQEVLGLLDAQPQTPYSIASQMSWDMSYASWEDFPMAQKWFASGEALAHLSLLESRGEISRRMENGRLAFVRS